MRFATPPTKATATKTGSGRETPCGERNRATERNDRGPTRTKVINRPRRGTVNNRLLSAQQVEIFGTGNVRSLRGQGKPEQLASEIERYKVSVLAMTETHLTENGEMMLGEVKGYKMLLSGRQDGNAAEGVGLALALQAMAALKHYQAVSSRILTAEFLTKVGPLCVVVVYAPTDQCRTEEKDHFYSDLDSVMTRANSLTIVMGDFNATVGEAVQKVVGPRGLGRRTNDNGERLVSFVTRSGVCITNTFFPHKRIHRAHGTPTPKP